MPDMMHAKIINIESMPEFSKFATECLSQNVALQSFNSNKYCIFPGFCDVHVHFREPGFSYKETIKTGSMCAAKGGYTAVCTMPNLNPVPDNKINLEKQLEIISRDALIDVYPYGSITVGQMGEKLSDLAGHSGKIRRSGYQVFNDRV